MKVLNLLAHSLTADQASELAEHEVVSLAAIAPDLAKFAAQCPDDRALLRKVARELATLCSEFDQVIAPIGSPAFMAEFFALIGTDAEFGITVGNFIFAHSVRESVEVEINGTVEKKVVFKHVRFF